MQNNREIMVAIQPEQYVSLKEYCEETGVSITDAVDEAVEDFLLTSAAARLETIRATRGAKNNLITFPAVQVPGSCEPN